MGGIRCFLDPKPYVPLHLSLTIFRFSLQLDSPVIQILRKARKKKKPNQTGPLCVYWMMTLFLWITFTFL